MPDQVASAAEPTTPEEDGISQEIPATTGLAEADDIATWRKRQAGADAARAAAERERDELRKRVEAFEASEREKQQANMTAEARLQAELEAARRRADEAEARAQAKVLNTLYPKARAELPEVTDEVRLAKFEALLSDGEPASSGTRAMRAPKDASTPAQREETSADILARLKTLPSPFGRQS